VRGRGRRKKQSERMQAESPPSFSILYLARSPPPLMILSLASSRPRALDVKSPCEFDRDYAISPGRDT
jgi:hypothetical protein